MEDHCIACGMPLSKEEDIGARVKEGPVCKYCANPDGSVKDCQTIFEGEVMFFMKSVPGTDREKAERITRKNMNRLAYWKGKDEKCLEGEESTEEEFKATLDSLHSEIDKGNVKG